MGHIGRHWLSRGGCPGTLRAALALAGAILLPQPSLGAAAQPFGDGWYAPRQEDFRGAYDADAANAARQSWGAYWKWVTRFYGGYLLEAGWTIHAVGLCRLGHATAGSGRVPIRLSSTTSTLCSGMVTHSCSTASIGRWR